MIKKLQSVFLLVFSMLFFIACQKELNFPDTNTNTPGTSNGTAKYSFAGGSGNCAGAVISGVYNKGTALNSLNTIAIKVNIDSVGSYTIATANINGIIFSCSGVFTTTGAQTIVLKASGTPLGAGNFTYVPGTNGCSFNITVTANGALSGTAQFTFNGAPDSCITPIVSGNYIVGTVMNAADSVTVKVTVTTPGSYSVSTNSLNGILFLASGTFATSGQHIITLTGSGKPLNPGPFAFTPGTNGCKFTINFAAVTDCKECIYIPFCVGSKYDFIDTISNPFGGNDSAYPRHSEYLSAVDTTINGMVSKRINTFDGTNNNYFYTNCQNGDTRVIANNVQSTTSGNMLTAINSIELKANAPEGTVWTDTSTIGSVNKLYRTHTIVQKGISRTVLGVTYNDIIRVKVEQNIYYTDPAAGLISAGISDYYFAKGIGVVEVIGYGENPITNQLYVAVHSVLKFYYVP